MAIKLRQEKHARLEETRKHDTGRRGQRSQRRHIIRLPCVIRYRHALPFARTPFLRPARSSVRASKEKRGRKKITFGDPAFAVGIAAGLARRCDRSFERSRARSDRARRGTTRFGKEISARTRDIDSSSFSFLLGISYEETCSRAPDSFPENLRSTCSFVGGLIVSPTHSTNDILENRSGFL